MKNKYIPLLVVGILCCIPVKAVYSHENDLTRNLDKLRLSLEAIQDEDTDVNQADSDDSSKKASVITKPVLISTAVGSVATFFGLILLQYGVHKALENDRCKGPGIRAMGFSWKRDVAIVPCVIGGAMGGAFCGAAHMYANFLLQRFTEVFYRQDDSKIYS